MNWTVFGEAGSPEQNYGWVADPRVSQKAKACSANSIASQDQGKSHKKSQTWLRGKFCALISSRGEAARKQDKQMVSDETGEVG